MEFQQWYNSLPNFTRIYMVSVFVTTFCISYIKHLPVGMWFVLDFDLVFNNFHLWRLLTNFLVIGKFSFQFLLFLIMIYNTLSKLEKTAVENRRYAEFVMLIVYCVMLVIVRILN